MSKTLEPRKIELSDYKEWFKQTHELVKRQWFMAIFLVTMQIGLVFLTGSLIKAWADSGFVVSSIFDFVLMTTGFLLILSLVNMRFFYVHLAYSSDFSLGKGPFVLWNSIQKHSKNLMTEYKIIFMRIGELMLKMMVYLGILYIIYLFSDPDPTPKSIPGESMGDPKLKPIEPHKSLVGIFIMYGSARMLCFTTGYMHKYPLIACLGLGRAEYNLVESAKSDKEGFILGLPYGFSFIAFVLLLMSCGGPEIGYSMPYLPLFFVIIYAIINVYSDFLAYVMCRDIYLGTKENQTEKAKETSAVPQAVN